MRPSARFLPHSVLATALAVTAALGVTAASAAASGPASHRASTAVPACPTSSLTAWIGLPGNGAAGSIYYELQLSNTSTVKCSLFGYPGVSAVNSSGTQLGSPAARDTSIQPTTVVLAPGATSHFLLRLTNTGVLANCTPAAASAFRIFPPNQTTPTRVSFKFQACSNKGPIFLHVRTVRPGAGIPGFSQ